MRLRRFKFPCPFTLSLNDKVRHRSENAPSSASATTSLSTSEVPSHWSAPVRRVYDCVGRKDYDGAVQYFESSFQQELMSLVDFAGGPSAARDLVISLMRTFTVLGQMNRVRDVFAIGLRDLSPLILNASFFNAYLEVLTLRKNFAREEVVFVLQEMKSAAVSPNELTFHYLIELHIRMGVDPVGLWVIMRQDYALHPLPCTLHALIVQVIPYTSDASFVVDVTREALLHGNNVMDKQFLAEMVEQWLRKAQDYPPEYVLWLMFELELRCVLDKASFVQFIQKQHVAELLQRCAKCADAGTAAKVLAMMDRHVMTKTADVLSLVVWCWAQAQELEKAFDLLELMARKGHLELTDPFRKYTVDCLRQVMDRHFMMALADAMSSSARFERVLRHLRVRREREQSVSVHSLDLAVLAAAKLGEERRAMTLVSSYVTEWGIQPRTNTYNCLLVGLTAQRGASMQRAIYDAMCENGVSPNAFTFRVLIRQAALADCIDEAMEFLHKVAAHEGLRVEVEMILPVLERAARAGDAETVNKVSKFALDCDIGIDSAVLSHVTTLLTEAGQDVEVFKGHHPLHEALRSRSKTGRQRARSDIIDT